MQPAVATIRLGPNEAGALRGDRSSLSVDNRAGASHPLAGTP